MSDYISDHLKLSFIAPAQMQKHVTANETFAVLDAACQAGVIAMDCLTPPDPPEIGARYLLGAAPTGRWQGKAGQLAVWRNGGWNFLQPKPGWRIYNLADDTLYAMGASGGWSPIGTGGGSTGGAVTAIQNATGVGIGTASDAETPFSAKLNAALWNARSAAEGGTGDLFVKLNKSAAARDLGHLFQTAFVTRALAGLFGSNRYRIAVSPDGTTFRDALTVDDATGIVDQPQLPRFKGLTNFDNLVPMDTWTKIAINTAETNGQGALNPATGRFTAPIAGDYCLGATLVYRQAASTNARMRGRLVVNGTAEIPGTFGEISGAHQNFATALFLQTVAPLSAGDSVELQGYYRGADALFAANQTTFWGFKIG